MESSQNPKSPLLICKCSLGMRARIPHPSLYNQVAVWSEVDLSKPPSTWLSKSTTIMKKYTFHIVFTTFSRIKYHPYQVLKSKCYLYIQYVNGFCFIIIIYLIKARRTDSLTVMRQFPMSDLEWLSPWSQTFKTVVKASLCIDPDIESTIFVGFFIKCVYKTTTGFL